MTSLARPNAALEHCPHCGSDAQLEPHPDLRFKCKACGRPRLPLGPAEPTPPEVAALLRQAASSRMSKFGWKTAGFGLIALGVCTGFLSLLVGFLMDAQLTGTAVLGLFTLAPVLLSLFAFRASKTAGAKSGAQLDEAWQKAVSALYRARNGALDAPALAQAFSIPTEQAAQLLAEAEVTQWLSPDHSPALRVRVSPEEAEFARLAEQELQEALGHADTAAFDSATFASATHKPKP